MAAGTAKPRLFAPRYPRVLTIFFACIPEHVQHDEADLSIRVLTGPEVITGSTRMKAGTATKMVLNMITTISMIRIGKVYENLMVDLDSKACAKLRDRACRIVQAAVATDREEAKRLLDVGEDLKTAIVMHSQRCGADTARQLLRDAGGKLHNVLP